MLNFDMIGSEDERVQPLNIDVEHRYYKGILVFKLSVQAMHPQFYLRL